MNIAIIIGVSEYNKIKHLPACLNDSNLIHSILTKTEKYKEILYC